MSNDNLDKGKVDNVKLFEKIFDDCKIALLRKNPLYYWVLKALTVRYVDKYEDRVARVENNVITVYKGMMLNNKWENIVSIMVHLIVHVILKHSFRAENWRKRAGIIITKKGSDKWNFIVNLLSDGKVEQYVREEDAFKICISQFKDFKKMSIEECLDKLLEESESTMGGAGKGEQGLTQGKDLDKGEEGEDADAIVVQQGVTGDADEIEAKVEENVARGLVMQKLAGRGAGELERMLEKELLKGKTLNWHELLLKLIGDEISKGKVGDWRRISRKLPDLIPGLRDIHNPKVWILVDVSGSISNEEYGKFVRKMMGVTKVAEVEVIFWDDGIQERRKVRYEKDFMRVSKGYGGTTFSPVLDAIKKEVKSNHVIVVMTDCYWSDTSEAIKKLKAMKCKRILVTTDEVVEGFHKVIRVETD